MNQKTWRAHGKRPDTWCGARPYGHRLLSIGADASASLRKAILGGRDLERPGRTLLGFSVLMSDAKAEAIINAVDRIARDPMTFDRGLDRAGTAVGFPPAA